MSLTPHWYSTIFGVYFFAGSFVGFIALLSVVAAAMRGAGLLDTVISAEHLQDIGKLLFGFTAFWAYIAFSQFFLMLVPEPPGGDDLVQGAARGVLEDDLESSSWRATSGFRSFT